MDYWHKDIKKNILVSKNIELNKYVLSTMSCEFSAKMIGSDNVVDDIQRTMACSDLSPAKNLCINMEKKKNW